MVISTIPTMPNASNITLTTELTLCNNSWLNLNGTISDLQNLYQSNISTIISNIFFNVSILHFDCTRGTGKYFEQIIVFTQAVSIHTQILLASIYFDFIKTRSYLLNGFAIDPEKSFNLSSITVNDSAKYDACSSADAAQDPLCSMNLSNSVCTPSSNPWNFTCSQVSTTTSLFGSTTNNRADTTIISTSLTPWQIGLICGLSIFFVLFLIFLAACFYRRYTRSKHLPLSRVNLYDDSKTRQKSGIPLGQAFQRAATLVQPKRSANTGISWIHEGSARNDENYITLKPPGPYNQATFVDHAKVHDPGFPSTITEKSTKPIHTSTSPHNKPIPTVISTGNTSRPVSGTSMNQLKSITEGLEEDKLNESNLSSPKKADTSVSRQFVNTSSVDESLHDEDAWMSILDVVNAELAVLNEQDRTRTLL